jgi:hypothetical protein
LAYCTLSFVNEVQAEKDAAAYMLITPMSKMAFSLLGASGHTENKKGLLVTLVLLTLSTKKYQDEVDNFRLGEQAKTRLLTVPNPEDILPLSPYHLARHILKVPEDLVDFLKKSPRQCIIWPELSKSKTHDVWISEDTKFLQFVLKHNRALVSSPKGHIAARIVFVHVGRMKDMHTMPRIARLRGAPLDLQFLTYGTHPTVPSREWGIHGFNKSGRCPAFSLVLGRSDACLTGGIVTFTTNALLSDLEGVDRLIERVASHEHWACYVTPTVLGAAVRWARELEYPTL